mgnify:CR=1 FL=1
MSLLLQRSPDLVVGDRNVNPVAGLRLYLLQRSPDLVVGDRQTRRRRMVRAFCFNGAPTSWSGIVS